MDETAVENAVTWSLRARLNNAITCPTDLVTNDATETFCVRDILVPDIENGSGNLEGVIDRAIVDAMTQEPEEG